MWHESREAFFESMVKAYGPKLYSLIRSIVLNHDDADDLLQETLIKAWNGLASFRNEASHATWLYRIALNEALKHQRRAALKKRFMFKRSGNHQTSAAEEDAETVLTAALEKLSPRQRSIFAMHYFDELAFSDIASMLGISEATAKATYHQSANKIKQFIHLYADN
ncbi:MAG: RNA polymerase sigma factor [Bacteroidia bacterium]|nr:RNA polymerase sigma factor [Bacteroidia bacterium]